MEPNGRNEQETTTFDPFVKETAPDPQGEAPNTGTSAPPPYEQNPQGNPYDQGGPYGDPRGQQGNPYGPQGNPYGNHGAPPPQGGPWYQPPPQNGGFDYYGNRYYNPQNTNKPKGNGMSIASMILGIASIVMGTGSYIGIILSVMAIIFACVAKDRTTGKMNGMAKAGLICGIIGLVLTVVAIMISLFASFLLFEAFTGDGTTPPADEIYEVVTYIIRFFR